MKKSKARYVLINELYSFGGTEVQGKREKRLMESKGHEVLYITFDLSYAHGFDPEDAAHYNFRIPYGWLQTKIYRLIADKRLEREVRHVIDGFAPDFIHINNADEHAQVIYRAVKGYPVFQTLRDYTSVCPTGLCIDRNKQICEGMNYCNCIAKCTPQQKKGMFLYWYLIRKRIYHIRTKVVPYFVCPSQTLTDYCNRHGLNTTCINNPFDFSAIQNQHKQLTDKKVYLYYGLIAPHKGVRELLNAFDFFAKGKKAELLLAGKCQPDMQGELERYRDHPQIHYLGLLPQSRIMELLRTVNVVVVPSLWMENYPNTVLEGLCCECIVIASSRGGMKEMIRDDRLIFDVLNQQDMIEKLEYTYHMDDETVRQVTAANKAFVLENNSMEKYYQRITKFLKEKVLQNAQDSL